MVLRNVSKNEPPLLVGNHSHYLFAILLPSLPTPKRKTPMFYNINDC